MAENGTLWSRRAAGLSLRRRSLLASAGAASLLAACGGSKRSTTAQPAAQTGKPRSGGQFNVAEAADPSRLDPTIGTKAVPRVLMMTNSSLASFKAGPGIKYTDLQLQPELADRWEQPDTQTYTFHLHNPVKFANLAPANGRDLTSQDVKWTYEYLSRTGDLKSKGLPPSGIASLFTGLDRVETPDPSTAVFHFSQPFAPFLSYAATYFAAILAHEIFDEDGNFVKRAVGSGPWQLDPADSHAGEHWAFKKNPTYFVQGRPYIDQINWLILPESATVEAAFISKQIDILDYDSLTVETAQRVAKAAPAAFFYQDLDYAGHHIYINVTKPPLDDERIRKAFALCIDRDEFIKTFAAGKGRWALAAAKPDLFTDEETKQILKFDPAQAQQLVTQAGYPNGVDVEFLYNTDSYGAIWGTKIQLLQSQAKKGNIHLKLKLVDSTTADNARRSGNFQLNMTLGPPGISVDPDNALYPLFYPGSPGNRGRVNDPTLTPMLVAERRETDPAKRKEIVRQAVRRINEVPDALALYYGNIYNLWWPYLKNYAPNMGAYGRRVNESWLEK